MLKCSRCKSGIARDRFKKIDGKIVCKYCAKHGNKNKGKGRHILSIDVEHRIMMKNADLVTKLKKLNKELK